MTDGEILLTPTEDLLMEVLAARYRLGETSWTFQKRHAVTVKKLESRGLVRYMHGIVENTCRASLTVCGVQEYIVPSYVAPVLRRYKLKKKFRLTRSA